VNKLIGDTNRLSEIQRCWQGPKSEADFKVLVGPVGSGAAVRSDDGAIEELQSQHRKIIGLEMEAFGVLSAAFASPFPEVRGFVMKGVSDFADSEKSDNYQDFAAYTSANVLKLFAEKYLPF
jgi:nucleoside phosphorylase